MTVSMMWSNSAPREIKKALTRRPGLKVQEGQQSFLAVAMSAIVVISVP